MNTTLTKIKMNTSWSIFLDRDGVINERIPGAYIKDWSQFAFRPSVLNTLAKFNTLFNRILVVTNQQGIGKQLMTEQDLNDLHQKMLEAIESNNGRIDQIYFCPDLKNKANNCRKPASTMGRKAKREFPDIDFSRSIMVGDSISDIEFGHRLGMQTILVTGKKEEKELLAQLPLDQKPHFMIDQFKEILDLIT